MSVVYQEERLVSILNYLKIHQRMSAHEICDHFQVSRDTARRDIVRLAEQGAAIRTHGGIALPGFQDEILAYRERLQTFSAEKMKIGSKALTLIHEKGCYFFDTSTTVSCMARLLDTETDVFTHSLDIAEILSRQTQSAVFLFGGTLNTANRYLFDVESVRQMEKIHFDCSFLGAAGVTDDGFYYDDKDDAFIKGTVAARSGKTVVLADSKKFTKKSRYKGLAWENADTLITNERPPASIVHSGERNGTELIFAE